MPAREGRAVDLMEAEHLGEARRRQGRFQHVVGGEGRAQQDRDHRQRQRTATARERDGDQTGADQAELDRAGRVRHRVRQLVGERAVEQHEVVQRDRVAPVHRAHVEGQHPQQRNAGGGDEGDQKCLPGAGGHLPRVDGVPWRPLTLAVFPYDRRPADPRRRSAAGRRAGGIPGGGRLRLPGLVLFLGVGMALGSDGAGWIDFGDYHLARRIGVIALALILFEGGLSAGFAEIRPVLRPAVALATGGTVITAVITGLVAAWLFDFSTLEGLLLGAILASTDSAAIFALLRGSTLRRRLARTLEGEAGFNDPVAVILVLGFIDWIRKPDYGLADMALLLVRQLGIGLAVGLAVGWLSVQAIQRVRLNTAGLYPVATIAMAALSFGVADVLHGSGFLAVYLVGLVAGQRCDTGAPDRHRVPPGPRLGGADHPLPHARACSCSRPSSATWRSRPACWPS